MENSEPTYYDLQQKIKALEEQVGFLQKTADETKKENLLLLQNLEEANENIKEIEQKFENNIKELNKTSNTLKLSEDKFRKAFYTNPDSININRLHDGMYVSVNKGFTQIMGYTEEEVIGKTSIELNIWANLEERKNLVDNLLKNGSVENFEAKFNTKSGKQIDGIMSAAIIELEGIQHIINISRDITALKLTQKEIIDTKEKAEESNRLKIAFMQNLSHEIRTPMNAIIGFADFLNNPNLTLEKRQNYSKILIKSANQLLNIVNDILTISSLETHQETINLEPIWINDILDEVFSVFKTNAADRNIQLIARKAYDNNESHIYSDRVKICQVLTNLLSNALKFINEGYVEFGYYPVDKESSNTEKFITFFVTDTGIGIEAEIRDSVFEHFRQGDNSITKKYGGTGLGLSICKGFVQLLGGKIWFETEFNKGTTFYFTIPYKFISNSCLINFNTSINENKYILIAEDEDFNYILIEEILQSYNLNILRARDGKESLDICRSNSLINLVLMDIRMPIMDGYEAAKRIKEIRPNLPIIAQTAYAQSYEISKYRAIFNDYVTKPIRASELLTKLMKYIN